MDKYIKNMEHSKVLELAVQTEYLPGQIVSKTLAQNSNVSLTLFAFDKGEEISTHASDGDAMVVALDGAGRITIGEEEYHIKAGETLIMPSKTPHAVYAEERFKMFLIVVFPGA